MYFKDRKSDFTNRKKLIVVDPIIRDENGEIKEIVADVIRQDLNIIEQGTPLNAEVLNSRFDSVYESLAFLYQQYFTANLNDTWYYTLTSTNYKNFFINLKNTMFYAKVHIPHGFLTANVIANSNPINIIVYETSKLHNTPGTFTWNLEFYVELYSDQACTKFVTRLKGIIKYINNSTNPLD